MTLESLTNEAVNKQSTNSHGNIVVIQALTVSIDQRMKRKGLHQHSQHGAASLPILSTREVTEAIHSLLSKREATEDFFATVGIVMPILVI